MKYEQVLKQLEDIVTKLETGNLDLEQSIALYEKGIKLSAQCNKMLGDARDKLEVLSSESGELSELDEAELGKDDEE